jgi:hypothetical protein
MKIFLRPAGGRYFVCQSIHNQCTPHAMPGTPENGLLLSHVRRKNGTIERDLPRSMTFPPG